MVRVTVYKIRFQVIGSKITSNINVYSFYTPSKSCRIQYFSNCNRLNDNLSEHFKLYMGVRQGFLKFFSNFL